jgi:hypothetical protein
MTPKVMQEFAFVWFAIGGLATVSAVLFGFLFSKK